MPLNPQAQAYLDQRAAAGARQFYELPVAEAREQAVRLSKLMGTPEPVASVEERVVPCSGVELPVRIYKFKTNGASPVLVYFHGGGWVTGNLDTSDVWCRAFTNAAQCILVSVNYRHAPEHKFPTAVEDAFNATRWVSTNAQSLGGDPMRIAVGGASAGGNLAAVVALMARDREPSIAYQLLWAPVINYAFDTASYRDNAQGYGLTAKDMQKYWELYLPSASDAAIAYASPVRATSHSGLPRAHVLTAEFDPLRDEGEAYAARLRRAGVRVVHHRYDGMVHAFLGPQALEDAAKEFRGALS
jgi:acetyl esterase/lipase